LAGHGRGALAELPVRGEGLVREETLEMYFSTRHWRPIVHGYTAYSPQLTRLLRRLLPEVPSHASPAALRRVGVSGAVVHHGREFGVELQHQVTGADREEKLRRALAAAGLDLYARLPAALASGRLKLLARIGGPEAHLFESTLDEVYALGDV